MSVSHLQINHGFVYGAANPIGLIDPLGQGPLVNYLKNLWGELRIKGSHRVKLHPGKSGGVTTMRSGTPWRARVRR